jgi:hypothetical protein
MTEKEKITVTTRVAVKTALWSPPPVGRQPVADDFRELAAIDPLPLGTSGGPSWQQHIESGGPWRHHVEFMISTFGRRDPACRFCNRPVVMSLQGWYGGGAWTTNRDAEGPAGVGSESGEACDASPDGLHHVADWELGALFADPEYFTRDRPADSPSADEGDTDSG